MSYSIQLDEYFFVIYGQFRVSKENNAQWPMVKPHNHLIYTYILSKSHALVAKNKKIEQIESLQQTSKN